MRDPSDAVWVDLLESSARKGSNTIEAWTRSTCLVANKTKCNSESFLVKKNIY